MRSVHGQALAVGSQVCQPLLACWCAQDYMHVCSVCNVWASHDDIADSFMAWTSAMDGFVVGNSLIMTTLHYDHVCT